MLGRAWHDLLVIWFMVVVLVVIVGIFVLVASGRGESMAEVYDDRPDSTVPAGRMLTADDIEGLRFSTSFRGYRMDEVDAFLDQLRADLLNAESWSARARPTAQRAAGDPDPGDGRGESATIPPAAVGPVDESDTSR
ncbi:MAG: DivIVA domain-containing protein, partial [Nocardioidaceae bacterium]